MVNAVLIQNYPPLLQKAGTPIQISPAQDAKQTIEERGAKERGRSNT